MNQFTEKTDGKRTWNRYDFVKFLDGDSIVLELNKTMADVIFQTIVNQTLSSGTAITEFTFNKFGYLYTKMMISKVRIISCETSNEEEVLNFATSVTGHKRYLNLKKLLTFVIENDITVGDMSDMENMDDNDTKFGFFSVDERWAFKCEIEPRTRRRRERR